MVLVHVRSCAVGQVDGLDGVDGVDGSERLLDPSRCR